MHPVFTDSYRDDDEAVMSSAETCRLVAESEAAMEDHPWSARVQYARETEDAAKDFIAARSERTALILLGRTIAVHHEAPKSLSCEHLMFVAAAHIAASDHPMAKGMSEVPPLGKSAAAGRSTVASILRVWDAWMATQVDPERTADELMAMDELEVREL